MRRITTVLVLLFAALVVTASAKVQPRNDSYGATIAVPKPTTEESLTGRSGAKMHSQFPSNPISPLVSISGADVLPITNRYENATNGKSLHSLLRDPDDSMKLHFISMVATDPSIDDTDANVYNSRRVMYTYSSDGGATWTAGKVVGSDRLGFPDMVLYKRNGVYVPIIAGHNGPNSLGNSDWTTFIYIEQGQPGDGNFARFTADQLASDGSTKDIGYPSLGVSLTQDTLYVLGCVLNTTANPNPESLEFGRFALAADGSATWLGWKQHPAGDATSSHAAAGKCILAVAPNGKLGVLWACGEKTDGNLYFVESNDGGLTWTNTYAPVYTQPTTQITATGGGTYDCFFAGFSGGMDVYYDATNRPHFMWVADWDATGDGVFFPLNSTAIFTWAMGDATVTIPTVFNDPGLTDMIMFDSTICAVNTLNPVDYFTAVDNPSTPHTTVLWNATTTVSANPNVSRIFYTTFQDGDALADIDVFDDGTLFETRLYRNIYYVQTTDGGVTWGAPTPFAANDPAGDPESKLDYHFASTPLNSPFRKGGIGYDVVFQVDTFPGPFQTGQAGWTDQTWYHKGSGLLSVGFAGSTSPNSLGSNFPNPVASTTTIPVSLTNSGKGSLTVQDILGREVMAVYNGSFTSGNSNFTFNTASLPTGVYRIVLNINGEVSSRLMNIVR